MKIITNLIWCLLKKQEHIIELIIDTVVLGPMEKLKASLYSDQSQ